jgi:hypothetical protein
VGPGVLATVVTVVVNFVLGVVVAVGRLFGPSWPKKDFFQRGG